MREPDPDFLYFFKFYYENVEVICWHFAPISNHFLCSRDF